MRKESLHRFEQSQVVVSRGVQPGQVVDALLHSIGEEGRGLLDVALDDIARRFRKLKERIIAWAKRTRCPASRISGVKSDGGIYER